MKRDALVTDDELAETEALRAAVEQARADRRAVPHEEMRAWLLRVAAGEAGAAPPCRAPSNTNP